MFKIESLTEDEMQLIFDGLILYKSWRNHQMYSEEDPDKRRYFLDKFNKGCALSKKIVSQYTEQKERKNSDDTANINP